MMEKNKKYILYLFSFGLVFTIPFGMGMYFIYRHLRRKKRITGRLRLNKDGIVEVSDEDDSEETFTSGVTSSYYDSASDYSPPLNETRVLKVLNKVLECVMNHLSLAYEIIREDYDHKIKKFKNTNLNLTKYSIGEYKLGTLKNIEKEISLIYESMGVNEKDYFESLYFFMKFAQGKIDINNFGGSFRGVIDKSNREKIFKRYKLIEKFLNDFKSDNAKLKIDIEFPKEIVDNFLKIFTNTFYHTLKSVVFKLKSGVLDKVDDKEENSYSFVSVDAFEDKIAKYTVEILGPTRKKIMKMFQVKDTDVRAVSLLRCYAFTLERSNPVRQKYEYLNSMLHKINENLKNKIIPREFVDVNDYYYTQEVIDDIIDLERLLKNAIDYRKF